MKLQSIILVIVLALTCPCLVEAQHVTLKYKLTADATVTLKIWSESSGNLVKTVLDNVPQSEGVQLIQWDGSNNAGNQVATGKYFYTLDALIGGNVYHNEGDVQLVK